MATAASQPNFSPSMAQANLRSARIAGLRAQQGTLQGAGTINNGVWTPEKDARRLRRLTTEVPLPASLPIAVQEAENNLADEQRYATQFNRSRLFEPQFSPEEQIASLGSQVASQGLSAARSKLRGLASAKTDAMQKQAMEKMKKLAMEKASRWGAKLGGHGLNAIDVFGEDGWITYAITYIYDWCRAVVTILVPEPPNEADQLTQAASKGIRFFIPPYRLTEPGDLLYFIGEFIVTVIIITILIAFLAAIFVVIKDSSSLFDLALATFINL